MEFKNCLRGEKEIHSLLSIPKHYTLGRVVNINIKYLQTQCVLNTDHHPPTPFLHSGKTESVIFNSPQLLQDLTPGGH